MIAEMFIQNRGSLHTRSFSCIHLSFLRYRWTINTRTNWLNSRTEKSPGLSRNGPWYGSRKARKAYHSAEICNWNEIQMDRKFLGICFLLKMRVYLRMLFSKFFSVRIRGRGWLLPITAYTGRLCPKGVPVRKRVGISQVGREIFKRAFNYNISNRRPLWQNNFIY